MSEEKKTDTAKTVDMETKTINDMVIEVTGEKGRIYRFSMPFYSPLPECHNAAINTANEIARIFKEAIDKQKEKEEAKKKEDETK